MAEVSKYSIITYERRPGYWRAAIAPIRGSGKLVKGATSSIVTPMTSGPSLRPTLQPKRLLGNCRLVTDVFP